MSSTHSLLFELQSKFLWVIKNVCVVIASGVAPAEGTSALCIMFGGVFQNSPDNLQCIRDDLRRAFHKGMPRHNHIKFADTGSKVLHTPCVKTQSHVFGMGHAGARQVGVAAKTSIMNGSGKEAVTAEKDSLFSIQKSGISGGVSAEMYKLHFLILSN